MVIHSIPDPEDFTKPSFDHLNKAGSIHIYFPLKPDEPRINLCEPSINLREAAIDVRFQGLGLDIQPRIDYCINSLNDPLFGSREAGIELPIQSPFKCCELPY